MRVSFLTGLAALGVLGIAFSLSVPGRVVNGNESKTPGAGARKERIARQPANPVVVELFTSEGCSDCPPADRLLYRLEQTQPVPGAEIIALEQHVDYWDNEGWRDPFSSAQFTQRQADYVRSLHASTAYTPQMVVDGATEFVGSDERAALAAIAESARAAKASVMLEERADPRSPAGTVSLHISLISPAGWKASNGADVLLAITEDDLSSNVARGENAGAQLHHRAVVRQLQALGKVNVAGSFSGSPDVRLAKNWKRANLRAVVFLQAHPSGRILGAATLPLSSQ